MSPENISAESPDTIGTIEMKNVGELVRDDQLAPVIVVAKLRRIDRRVSEDHYAICRERRGVAVHIVVVVGNHQIDFASGRSKLSAQLREGQLGVYRPASRLRLERPGEMHAKVRRLDRVPPIARDELSVSLPTGNA